MSWVSLVQAFKLSDTQVIMASSRRFAIAFQPFLTQPTSFAQVVVVQYQSQTTALLGSFDALTGTTFTVRSWFHTEADVHKQALLWQTDRKTDTGFTL